MLTKEREHARLRRTGTSVPSEHPGKDSGPNASKLSDGQRRSQGRNSELARPPMPVRWSAWLGRTGEFGELVIEHSDEIRRTYPAAMVEAAEVHTEIIHAGTRPSNEHLWDRVDGIGEVINLLGGLGRRLPGEIAGVNQSAIQSE